MFDELLDEERISVNDLAKELGFGPRTIIRWMDVGYRGHRLENFRFCSRRFTTRQAAARFFAETSGQLAVVGARI